MTASQTPKSFRARGQILPMVVIVLVVGFTLVSAALSTLPSRAAGSAALQRREERDALVEQRRDRIATLRTVSDRCHPATAHELARLLVMDGQWAAARDYADNYELRCGADPVVRNWGNAPRPHARS